MLTRMYIHMIILFDTGPYIRINSGSCETHGMKIITTYDQCEAALQFLGLGDGVDSYGRWSNIPYGCIFRPNGKGCLWNSVTNSNSPACGSPPSNIYDCICSTSGMNSYHQ